MAATDMIFTATINNTKLVATGGIFSIGGAMGIRGLSIKWISGTVRYKGNLALNGLGSEYIALVDGSPFSFSSQLAVSGFDIDVSAGVCEIALIK